LSHYKVLNHLPSCYILSNSGHPCTLQLMKVKNTQWNALLAKELIWILQIMTG